MMAGDRNAPRYRGADGRMYSDADIDLAVMAVGEPGFGYSEPPEDKSDLRAFLAAFYRRHKDRS